MKVACIQLRSGLKRQQNVHDTSELVRRAADDGAQLIVTPEMTNIVDAKASRFFQEVSPLEEMAEIEQFAALAQETGTYLIIGSMAVRLPDTEDGKGRAANRSFFYGPTGALISTYDKIHMFDVDLPGGETWKESAVYQPGTTAACVKTDLGIFAQTICYDVRFPQLYRSLAQAGAELITVPAAFTYQTGKAHWSTLLRARAIETGSFIVAAAQGGEHADGRKTWGHSMIVGPWGDVLAEKEDMDPGWITADVDLVQSAEARQRIPNLSLNCNPSISYVEAS